MADGDLDAREVAHAAAHFAANRERMATTRCMACWVTRAHCMCARLRRLRIRTELVDVLVAVHYKEYGKATNTAKLLPHLLTAAGGGASGEGAAGQTAAAGGSSLWSHCGSSSAPRVRLCCCGLARTACPPPSCGRGWRRRGSG